MKRRLRHFGMSPVRIARRAAVLLAFVPGLALAQTQVPEQAPMQSPMQASARTGTGASHTRLAVAPYIELDQTFVANLKGGTNDVLTYTTAAAGVDVAVSTRRAEAQANLRYEHQFGWNRYTRDQDLLSGIARGSYELVPQALRIEGGALASRVRGGAYSGAYGSLPGAGNQTRSIYSFYAGPTLATHAGDLSVNAAYRFGYTKVDNNYGLSGTEIGALGGYDHSTSHIARASVGMQPGELPFGWALGAGYERENVDALDQRYEDKWLRSDFTLPVSPTLALVGGVGYEKLQISQRQVVTDADGNPELDSKGRYVLDMTVPRLMAYDTDGIIWDVGVLWRPSRRTSLEARVGRRYDSMHYIGNFRWQISPEDLFQLGYFDTIDSFGRSMNNGLAALPTSFETMRNPFSGELTGCVSGQSGTNCLNDTLAAISASNYRYRGVAAQFTHNANRWNWGAALGYSQRKFLAPSESIFAAVNGQKDYYYFAQLFGARRLDAYSTLGGSLYASHSDRAGYGGAVTDAGGYVTYGRLFGRRLMGRAALGLDVVNNSSIEDVVTLLGQVGVRYQF